MANDGLLAVAGQPAALGVDENDDKAHENEI
jgi:hypothetical protein